MHLCKFVEVEIYKYLLRSCDWF